MNPKTTIDRLKKWKGDYRRVAKESEVPYSTLTKIVSGFLDNPRKSTLDKINGWLSKHRAS